MEYATAKELIGDLPNKDAKRQAQIIKAIYEAAHEFTREECQSLRRKLLVYLKKLKRNCCHAEAIRPQLQRLNLYLKDLGRPKNNQSKIETKVSVAAG